MPHIDATRISDELLEELMMKADTLDRIRADVAAYNDHENRAAPTSHLNPTGHPGAALNLKTVAPSPAREAHGGAAVIFGQGEYRREITPPISKLDLRKMYNTVIGRLLRLKVT